MIYLIGGAPKCGKTTLAKALSKSLSIPWVSTDTLQCVIKPYINKEDFKKRFPVSHQRGEDNDEKYSKYSTDEIIEAYQEQAKTVYEAIDMFTACEISDGNDFIIEGYHVEPELAVLLESKYKGKVKSIFLVKSNKGKFIHDIKKSTTLNDWIIARTHNEETYEKIANMICKYGDFFQREAKKYNLRVSNMDDDFNGRVEEVIQYFLNN